MALANIYQKGISVVICCFNSSRRIVPTIEHLCRQKDIDFAWEVILVDNNSTDGTAEIAMEAWSKNNGPCPFRIIQELNPGTMHARKKGIEMSNYRYLLYCDDDNWLHERYLKTAFSIISKDENISAVGGIGLLEFEKGFVPPPWIFDYIKSFGGPQGKKDGDITFDKGCLYTAGAVLDRVWLNRLYSSGFESSLTGRDGKSLVAGEDTELTYALKLIGGKLHYSSQMHFKHFMPSGRMTWKYLKKLGQSSGYASFLISPYKMHFKKKKPHAFTVIILQRIILLTRSFVLATVALFAEGDRNVLQFQKAIGQFKAAVFQYKTFLRNLQMVSDLLRQVKNRGIEKI
jgi:glycosyltransferase involved in cell wall biosynthesis